jgi:hypothetical protein
MGFEKQKIPGANKEAANNKVFYFGERVGIIEMQG